MSRLARNRLIVALDTGNPEAALNMAKELAPWVGTFKFTPDAVMRRGEGLVGSIRELGCRTFLDLKLYDIPQTVQRAAATAAQMGVDFLTVHAGGGRRMLEAAQKGAAQGGTGKLKLLGVTVLTSMSQAELETEWQMKETIERRVMRWAALAKDSGLAGIVCSPHELESIRRELGHNILAVVPGIRAAGEEARDQRRTMPAAEAISRGADMLVVGRPIIESPEPASAARAILAQIAEAESAMRTEDR